METQFGLISPGPWGSYVTALVGQSGALSDSMEDNGARSNPQAQVELSRLNELRGRLFEEAATNPVPPRSVSARASPVLETVSPPPRTNLIDTDGSDRPHGRPPKWLRVSPRLHSAPSTPWTPSALIDLMDACRRSQRVSPRLRADDGLESLPISPQTFRGIWVRTKVGRDMIEYLGRLRIPRQWGYCRCESRPRATA
jgi:hypothetical protein